MLYIKSNIHILCVATFFSKIVPFMISRHATDYKTANAHCMLDN